MQLLTRLLRHRIPTFCFITAEKGEVATAKGDGEKKKECTTECKSRRRRDEKAPTPFVCDFGDFGVSFAATVAGRYTRRGGPRLSVQGEPLIVLTRGP